MSDSDRHSLLSDPEHWRRQAAEMRKLAEGSRLDVRDRLPKVAAEYEALAGKAEQRLKQAWGNRSQ
jgi:hypothetical protein